MAVAFARVLVCLRYEVAMVIGEEIAATCVAVLFIGFVLWLREKMPWQ